MLHSEAGSQSIRLVKSLVSLALEHYSQPGTNFCLSKSVFKKYQPKGHVFIRRHYYAEIEMVLYCMFLCILLPSNSVYFSCTGVAHSFQLGSSNSFFRTRGAYNLVDKTVA